MAGRIRGTNILTNILTLIISFLSILVTDLWRSCLLIWKVREAYCCLSGWGIDFDFGHDLLSRCVRVPRHVLLTMYIFRRSRYLSSSARTIRHDARPREYTNSLSYEQLTYWSICKCMLWWRGFSRRNATGFMCNPSIWSTTVECLSANIQNA